MPDREMVPYALSTLTRYPQTLGPDLPGQAQGVYLTLHPAHLESILAKITGWFAGRQEVRLLDHGLSDKLGLGYLLLEWREHEIDPLFLAIVRDEDLVADYTVYMRDLEPEEE